MNETLFYHLVKKIQAKYVNFVYCPLKSFKRAFSLFCTEFQIFSASAKIHIKIKYKSCNIYAKNNINTTIIKKIRSWNRHFFSLY